MRSLSINKKDFGISEKDAKTLQEKGILYECGEEHDLHLTPDHKFTHMDVEELLLSIIAISTPSKR